MDVTATLRLVDDVTANPDLVRLLTGPRWQVGPRDLALLGRRARELARARRTAPPGRSRRATRPPCSARSSRRSPTSTRPRWSACSTPWRTRATRPTPPRRSSGSRGWRPSSAYLRRHSDEPVLDLTRRVVVDPGAGRRADGDPRVRADARAATSSAPSSTPSPTTSTSTATPRCPVCWPTCRPRSTRAPGWSRPCRRTARR